MKKVRVTHTVVTTALVSMDAYDGMSPEQAVAWETGQSQDDMAESVALALAMGDEVTVACRAEVVDVPEDGS